MARTITLSSGTCTTVHCGPGLGRTVGTILLTKHESVVVVCPDKVVIVKCGTGITCRQTLVLRRNENIRVCCT